MEEVCTSYPGYYKLFTNLDRFKNKSLRRGSLAVVRAVSFDFIADKHLKDFGNRDYFVRNPVLAESIDLNSV
jgi:hypothetical protein